MLTLGQSNEFVGTTYKHNNIVDYALKVNLKNYFGWSLEPMEKGQKKPVEKDLFE